MPIIVWRSTCMAHVLNLNRSKKRGRVIFKTPAAAGTSGEHPGGSPFTTTWSPAVGYEGPAPVDGSESDLIIL